MKENVVIMVGSYYPNYSAVGRCMGNIAEELVRRGYKVTVISQKTDLNEPEKEYVNGHTIIRFLTRRKRQLLLSGESEHFLDLIKHFLYRGLKSLEVLLKKQTVYRDEIEAYVKELENLPEEPSIIVPACLPFETICSAMEYKDKHSQVQIYPVLYDFFAMNGRLQRLKINAIVKKKYNQQLEIKMLNYSQRVFGLHTWYEYIKLQFPEYLSKFTEIEHPLLTDSESWGVAEQNSKHLTTFVYAGSLDLTIRNPTYMLDFFDEYTKKYNCVLHMFSMGSAQPIVEEFAKKNSKIISHGTMPNSVVRKYLKKADCLISIGNTKTMQTPSKIFEYFCTGNPIVHFAFNLNDPVISTMEKYPNKYTILIGEPIHDEINSFSNFVSDVQHKKLPFSIISKLYAEATPSYVVDQIEI